MRKGFVEFAIYEVEKVQQNVIIKSEIEVSEIALQNWKEENFSELWNELHSFVEEKYDRGSHCILDFEIEEVKYDPSETEVIVILEEREKIYNCESRKKFFEEVRSLEGEVKQIEFMY